MKRALITGSQGQDGHFISAYLTSLGYAVFRMTRRFMVPDGSEFIYGDLCDEESLAVAFRKAWPDEIYNLGGQVFVPTSWDYAAETFNVNTGGLARILKIVEREKPDTKVYQASSSEMFGNFDGACNESTPLQPMSPYGVSKAAAHRLCALYRERGLFVVSGMLFNHESPRRGYEMVTRKIARCVAAWADSVPSMLQLGNMESRRDWGFAGDYVRAMYKMLQQPSADDFIIGTGISHSVSDFLLEACDYAGVDRRVQLVHTVIDERMQRTQEIHNLYADATKARNVLGWVPTVDFKGLVAMMVSAEVERRQKAVKAVSA
jgi:GDPmannose 4,6-dehydratase